MGILNLKDRSTADIVILFLTFMIAMSLLVTYVGVFLIEIIHPEEDTSTVVEASGEVIGLIVGAIVGYVAGKGQPKTDTEKSGG